MQNTTFGIVTFAMLIETLITYYKEFFAGGGSCWEMIASLVLGVTIAIAYSLDLPSYFNLNSQIPYLGNILTGILLSRGSNYIFDLLGKLSVS